MIGALSASKSLAEKLFIRRIQMLKRMILAAFVCSTILPSSGLAQGSFGGLVVPNMGQVKGTVPFSPAKRGTVPAWPGEISYYMDAPWGRIYVTEQGLLLNIITPEMQAADSRRQAAGELWSEEERAWEAKMQATSPFPKGGVVPLLAKEGLGEIYSEIEAGFGPSVQIPPGPFSKERIEVPTSTNLPDPPFQRGRRHPEPRTIRQTGILLTLPGACWREVVPEDPRITKLNFFYGNDPKGWVTDVPTYGRLRVKGIFPGTDLILEPKSKEFWHTEGLFPALLDGLRVQAGDGLRTLGIELNETAFARQFPRPASPPAPTEPGNKGRQEAQTMLWGTFLGGSWDDWLEALVLDAEDNAVVAGFTWSSDIPVPGGWDQEANGDYDIYVAKISADGKSLLWGTYIGGRNEDMAYCLDLDVDGNVVIGGSTKSNDIPVPGGYDTTHNSGAVEDIYAAKLSAEGNALLWGTYIGGSGRESAYACILNPSGDVILTGETNSPDIPVPGGFDTAWEPSNDYDDIYIALLSGNGSCLQWATYLGGDGSEIARSLCLDKDGNIVVAGNSDSSDIPAPDGYDTTKASTYDDLYIAKISIGENRIIWGTFIGGIGGEHGAAVAVDAAGFIIVFGDTNSPDMPVPGGYDTNHNGIENTDDFYVAKLSPDGKDLIWGTYLGGSGHELSGSCVLDAEGNIVIGGFTDSADMPIHKGYPRFSGGIYDMYVAKLASTGDRLIWGGYLGGQDGDNCNSVAVDREGNIVFTGFTYSPDFPVANGYDTVAGGPPEGVVVKLSNPGGIGVGQSLHVAVAARTSGAQGTSWRTDGMVLNPGSAEVCYDLHYLFREASEAKDIICESQCLAGRTAWNYSDILGSACDMEGESAGSLRIEPTAKLLMTTRTYNQTENGTYGQFIKAEASDEGLRIGEKGHLLALKQNTDYRTNLGFSEITGQETEVEIRIYNASGSLLITTSFQLPATGWLQVGLADLGISSLEVGRAEIEVTSGGAVLSYASVVDNRTGDAIYIALQKEIGYEYRFIKMIPAVAHTPGAYGSQWSSDVWIFNPYKYSQDISAVYETANLSWDKSIHISGFGYAEISDIVSSYFPEAEDGSGSLYFNFEHYTLSMSRTFNSSADGTFGQMIPSSSTVRLLFPKAPGRLLQLQCNTDFRTNVGFSEYSGQDAMVSVVLHGADGSPLGSGIYAVPTYKNVQVSDIFSALGVPCVYTAAYATVENISDGTVYAYASVVDNRTGDAIFIPAMK
jgi:hypothetical protein